MHIFGHSFSIQKFSLGASTHTGRQIALRFSQVGTETRTVPLFVVSSPRKSCYFILSPFFSYYIPVALLQTRTKKTPRSHRNESRIVYSKRVRVVRGVEWTRAATTGLIFYSPLLHTSNITGDLLHSRRREFTNCSSALCQDPLLSRLLVC